MTNSIRPTQNIEKNEPETLEQRFHARMHHVVTLVRPKVLSSPLVLAAPHSGRRYHTEWVKTLVQPLHRIRRTEDILVDHLVKDGKESEVALLRANFPRSFIDVNRARTELPPELGGVSGQPHRVNAGLGVIPTSLGQNLPLYNALPDAQQAERRLKLFYDPYHDALQNIIQETKTLFGQTVLLDMHSMPGRVGGVQLAADFVLGDRFGRSCRPELVELIRSYLRSKGFEVAYNHPYAGGYVTEHYGRPDDNVEVLQIEINRERYINPVTLQPNGKFRALSLMLLEMIEIVKDHYAGRIRYNPIAAE